MPKRMLIWMCVTGLLLSGCAHNPPVVARCPKPPSMPPSVMAVETDQDFLNRMLQILDQFLSSTPATPNGSGSRSEHVSNMGLK